MSRVRVHLVVSGRVQGVNFRYSTLLQAESLGITGWVRNMPNGRVELLAEGDEVGVKQLVEWCPQGPRSARVDRVEVAIEAATGEFDDFQIHGSYW
jgi:acylphosphatase